MNFNSLGFALQSLTAIEVACGLGARDTRCGEGPKTFRSNCDARLRSKGIELLWHRTPRELCGTKLPPLTEISQTAKWTANITSRLTAAGESQDSCFIVCRGLNQAEPAEAEIAHEAHDRADVSDGGCEAR